MQRTRLLNLGDNVDKMLGYLTVTRGWYLSAAQWVRRLPRTAVRFVVGQPIKVVNYALSSVVVLLTVLIVREVVFSTGYDADPMGEVAKAWTAPDLPPPSRKPLEYYRGRISGKHILRSPDVKQQKGGVNAGPMRDPDEALRLSKLVLVGVISGADPLAVIRKGESGTGIHYRVGDIIDGYIITGIDKAGVVLSKDGKKYELRL